MMEAQGWIVCQEKEDCRVDRCQFPGTRIITRAVIRNGIEWESASMDVQGGVVDRGIRRKRKRLRSEMSSRSKIFDRRFDGISVAGVGCFSGRDGRRNAGSGRGFGCGCGCGGDDDDDGVAHGGIAVSGDKVCRLDAESGSPFTVRTREVDDSAEMTGGGSFRTDGSRRDGENRRPSFRWGSCWVD